MKDPERHYLTSPKSKFIKYDSKDKKRKENLKEKMKLFLNGGVHIRFGGSHIVAKAGINTPEWNLEDFVVIMPCKDGEIVSVVMGCKDKPAPTCRSVRPYRSEFTVEHKGSKILYTVFYEL